MLQQTQVGRVIPKYKEFLKAFPTVHSLARAPLAKVFKIWSGLGYNRRAKYLHDAAKVIVEKYDSRIPREYKELRALPGVGDYTARAVRVFAFNESDILVETNIRTALIHHFYTSQTCLHKSDLCVTDAQVVSIAERAAEGQDPREWHWALMDYGAYLKRSGVRNNHKSAHYVRQSKFEGSLRQVRGQILRYLMNGEKGKKGKKWEVALTGLARDGLVVRPNGKWRIA